ncbi:MAG TPA: (2Fe-2S) ferredoxin domain-containing protein [Candidatus Avimonoglobus intestinipullorum]|uniref:(2Fe-2S) ferredoxin domain-containing protein n=1 Tax=Candidatus Avimonoglobus intestinipullorum TaxID=2840699 RepID=A0A9D1LUE6_9FIRM|nr:(2Fe-2S) ferredoxin domain-containing protein [Candidatus Avimonoglobus intestinipullorum]
MMNVYVCVGSSCHLKGSYDIINLMKEQIASHGLEDKVNLAAAFCLGKCTDGDGVSIKVEDEIVGGVNPANFNEIFKTYILDRV